MAMQGFGQSSVVYFTKDITPESLVSIYEALGVNSEGKRVAVKISTGESSRTNYLRPEFIKKHIDVFPGCLRINIIFLHQALKQVFLLHLIF